MNKNIKSAVLVLQEKLQLGCNPHICVEISQLFKQCIWHSNQKSAIIQSDDVKEHKNSKFNKTSCFCNSVYKESI